MLLFIPRSLCALKRIAAKLGDSRFAATQGIRIALASGVYRAEATDGRLAMVVQGLIPGEDPPWPGFKDLPDDACEAVIHPTDLDRACKVGEARSPKRSKPSSRKPVSQISSQSQVALRNPWSPRRRTPHQSVRPALPGLAVACEVPWKQRRREEPQHDQYGQIQPWSIQSLPGALEASKAARMLAVFS